MLLGTGLVDTKILFSINILSSDTLTLTKNLTLVPYIEAKLR